MATSGDHITTLGIVLAACVCAAFGNALQPVSLFVWLQPIFSLVAYDRLVLLKPAWGQRRPWLHHLAAATLLTITNALGSTVALAGVLSFPETTFASLGAAFGFALAMSSLTTVIALLGTHLACNAWPSSIAAAFVFPCLLTATHTVQSALISSFVSAGNALMDYEPLRQMCALWGLAGAVFLLGATAAVAYLHVGAASPALLGRGADTAPPSLASAASGRPVSYAQLPSFDEGGAKATGNGSSGQGATGDVTMAFGTPAALPTQEVPGGVSPALYRVTGLLLMAWCLVAVMGGLLAQAGLFYQVDVTTVIPPHITASCLIESSESEGSPGWARLWDRTAARLAAGDELVLWAEEAVNISYAYEATLLQDAAALLAQHGNRSYLGLSYQALHADSGRYTNHFTLLRPDGEVAWNYLKAYPVPVVESEVDAGPAVLPLHDSPFGRLSGAICFDLDHAHYAMTAAAAGVDVMLQPSWTWGAVGPRHFTGNQLRSLEGGYTIVRCSSSGVSGVVTPGGMVTTQVYTGASDEAVFFVPLFARRWTPYAHLGLHYVELVNAAVAVVVWCVVLLLPTLPAAWFAGRGAMGGPVLPGSGEKQQRQPAMEAVAEHVPLSRGAEEKAKKGPKSGGSFGIDYEIQRGGARNGRLVAARQEQDGAESGHARDGWSDEEEGASHRAARARGDLYD